jgi:hypothetical protein
MHVSEARLAANRLNGSKSKGPSSPEGRAISARNSYKHGLSGAGIVVPEGDRAEIERRVEALEADLVPQSPAGLILIRQMATLSVRSERAAEQEIAAIARNVRHAADDFDEERIEKANQLFMALGEDPRRNLRKLCKMPEGVERLIDAWSDLRADLAAEPKPIWTEAQLVQAANLSGIKEQHARATRFGALSRGFWGDFAALGEGDGGDLGEEFRREWARAALCEKIDAEIAALEAHCETLDFETIELDRAEAGQRALFDASKPACLARRYEAEANRGFFKALREFRKVEAESKGRAESAPTPSEPVAADAEVGSFREMSSPLARELLREFPDIVSTPGSVVRGADGQPLRLTPSPKSTR